MSTALDFNRRRDGTPVRTLRMQSLGLGDGSRIVLYDDSAVKTSARAWYMLSNKLVDMGAEVMGGTSAEFVKFTSSELKRYEAIVKNSGAPKE